MYPIHVRGVINGKTGKAAALPKVSDTLTLSQSGGADYAQPLDLPHRKNFVITPLYHVSLSFCTYLFTTSWELWKHPDPAPGGRPIFFKPEWPKESKNGFKTINYRPYPLVFFSKNCFWRKKIIKKIGCFVDFWIFMAIYMDKLDQF